MEFVAKSGVMFMQEEKAPETLSDREIVSLFFERNERALDAISRKYGAYCATVIRNILENEQETEECLNDTWLRAWESIPPEKPRSLGGFPVTLAKNISLNRYALSRTEKRGGGELPQVLDELSDIAYGSDVEKTFERKLLTEAVNDFLKRFQPKNGTFSC